MSLLELYVGKSRYTIDCQENEKEKIITLASKLNERVNKLSLQMRDADEKTILMLCAVMMEEELQSNPSLKNKQSDKDPQNSQQSLESKHEAEKIIAKNMEDISIYIENLANKIKNG